tara:strand:- start:233 stop:1000 length:768 start_codon:yes stop_codon:yes gene_type:complete
MKKSFGKSAAYLNQAVKMDPYSGSIYYVRAMLLTNQGDTISGINNLKEAIHLNPRLVRAYEKATELNIALKNIPEALKINNLALNRFEDRSELFYERAEIYRTISSYDTAIINYRKAIKIDPDYQKAHLKLAHTAIAIKAYHLAIGSLNRLMVLKKEDIPTINLLGYAYEKLGDFEKAKSYYSITLEKAPMNEDARYGMYRIKQRENAYLEGLNEIHQLPENDRLLDTTRVHLNIIQPRGTTKLKIDTLIKAKIE